MAQPTPQTDQDFMTLGVTILKAKLDLIDRRNAAANQAELAAMEVEIDRLEDQIAVLAKAHAKFLLSDRQITELISDLHQITDMVGEAQAKMTSAASALNAASAIVGLIAKLVGLMT